MKYYLIRLRHKVDRTYHPSLSVLVEVLGDTEDARKQFMAGLSEEEIESLNEAAKEGYQLHVEARAFNEHGVMEVNF